MKYLSLIFSLIFFLSFTVQVEGQEERGRRRHADSRQEMQKEWKGLSTSAFMVYGNCGMCKERIEASLADVKGVNSVDWNVDNKILTLTYYRRLISLVGIKRLIAAAGHDTDAFRAEEEAYNSLPACCQYERTSK